MAYKKIKGYLLWIMLALSLAATVWVSMAEETAEVGIQASKPRSTFSRVVTRNQLPQPDNQSEIQISPLSREKIEDTPIDLFQTQTLVMSEATTGDAPKQPDVPDIPYKYAGKLVEGDNPILFLINENKNRNYAVHKGDVIDRIWRVDEVGPTQITFSHIPSKTAILLPIGDSN